MTFYIHVIVIFALAMTGGCILIRYRHKLDQDNQAFGEVFNQVFSKHSLRTEKMMKEHDERYMEQLKERDQVYLRTQQEMQSRLRTIESAVSELKN